MTRLSRRVLLRLGLASLATRPLQAAPTPRVIALTARRFRYEPAEIILSAGEAVIIEITSIDFIHGMNIPDLGRRLDLTPGPPVRLALPPMAPGVIDFVCDNFCGSGHEEMHGRFIVQA